MKRWVVVLELAVGDDAAYLDLDEIDRLTREAARDGVAVMYEDGPLALLLEQRIAAHFALADGTVTTIANGTLGLSLALSAQGARPGTLCVLPAWTFVAGGCHPNRDTERAVEAAGFRIEADGRQARGMMRRFFAVPEAEK